jgi:hypothetical protein
MKHRGTEVTEPFLSVPSVPLCFLFYLPAVLGK